MGENSKRLDFKSNWFKKPVRFFQNNKIKTTIILILMVVYFFSLPRQLFENNYATVIESNEGQLLGAKIAKDGQWRFPESDSVPVKFKACILAF